MRRCEVCRLSIGQTRSQQLSVGFHRFPVDPEQRRAWERFCYGGPREIGTEKVVCSFHFEDGCFRAGTKRFMLKDGAVPTIREGRTEQNKNRFEKPFAIETPLEPLVKLENVCRICESTASLHDLTMEKNAEHARRFHSLTSIEVDSLAPYCCVVCLGHLNEAYTFVQRCIEAEENRKGSLIVSQPIMVKQEEVGEEEPVQEVWEEPMEEFNAGSSEEEEEDEDSDSVSEPESKGPKVHTCETCQATFEKKADLFAHVRAHGKSRFPCKLCDKSFARRYHLNLHMFSHDPDPSFFCTQCNMGFKTHTNLQRHIKGAHLKLKPFACEKCGKAFAQKAQLQSHAAVHMSEPDTPCQMCGKMFKTKARLRIHISMEHHQNKHYTCDACNKTFPTANRFYQHKGCHREPDFLCNICGNKYRTSALLKSHLTTHDTARPFQCDKCPSEFKSIKALKYHELVHAGLKPFQCEMCDRTFRCRVHLKTHTMSVHTKEKPHECHVCHRRFTLPGNMRLHMKMHQGGRKEAGEANPPRRPEEEAVTAVSFML